MIENSTFNKDVININHLFHTCAKKERKVDLKDLDKCQKFQIIITMFTQLIRKKSRCLFFVETSILQFVALKKKIRACKHDKY